ncbi:hypothetical protein [Emticicia agri]|uniref:Uncharacterized protein n=1 Tax=Emticicia agri TaxID=2492393 RepID=A0A4V1ZCH9_9BACT|nr:hypothetical protein [Emticicia agri]RYU92720.1 hypothetical protein EWM59_25780 [Emticicia agri]
MSQPISLFANYSQSENLLTNHCGLIMKMLYEESPRLFQELLANLTDAQTPVIIGPIFTQQARKQQSIPDLLIEQASFAIFFEVKETNWFYDDQLIRHINSFEINTKTKILFMLSDFNEDSPTAEMKESVKKAQESGVILQHLTFERLTDSLTEITRNTRLASVAQEFNDFLSANNYLPKWKYLLDAVNISRTSDEIADNVYMCPDLGGAYKHQKAKYFGVYNNKRVNAIHEIRAVVLVEKDFNQTKISWNISGEPAEQLITEALEHIRKRPGRTAEITQFGLQVFLLGQGHITEFIKDSPGGMYQSKKYFREIAAVLKVDTAKDLARELKGKKWSEFK